VETSLRVSDTAIRALLDDAAAVLRMPYPLPELRESANVSIPFTAGWSEPAIVLPARWRTWDEFKLRSILLHELGHVRRQDWATSVAAAINRAVFWCHPQAWWLERKLAALAEEACDSAAIASKTDEQRYAGVLLEFAMTGARQRVWVTTSIGQPSRVGFRIRRILEGRVARGYAVTRFSWAVILAAALPLVYSAAAFQLQPTAQGTAADQQDNGTHATILAEGWQLTPEAAARLEADLTSNPHNLSARTRLISHYYQRMIAEPRTRHVLWLIENHPDANVFRVASDLTDMTFPGWSGLNTQAGYERARELWLQQTKRRSTDTRILSNAVNALSTRSDPDIKLQLLRQVRTTEPHNPEWTGWLAAVFARASRDVYFAEQPASWPRRFTSVGAQRREGRFAFPLPLPIARSLKAEIETSTDAALVGETGELLVGEIALLRRIGDDTAELASSAAFGRTLLERAQVLDPGNPRWSRK
jgi:hypothetical protein